MADKNNSVVALRRRRKIVEGCSTLGLLLVAAALAVPFLDMGNAVVTGVMKWLYAAGALLFTGARAVNVSAPGDSPRLRRLRRMEMWAGFCFCVGAAFWFYNSARFGGIVFSRAVMNNTIAFTLAGAVIQVTASWMISSRAGKEERERNRNSGK